MHALTEIFIDRCYDPKIKNVKKALDLGANIGLASIWIWLEFPGVTIHAYEPSPEIYSILEKNLSPLSDTKTFNTAISNTKPSKTFYINNRSFSSSLYKISESNKILVKTKSLDEAIQDLGENVDFIKMDIEGEEFSVIKESKKISSIKVITGEAHPDKAGLEKNILKILFLKTHKVYKDDNKNKAIFYAKKD